MAITHNASTITITGFEDSDTLKAYVTSNNLGTVNGALLLLSPARNIDIQGDFVSYNTTYSGATFRSGIVSALSAADFGFLGDFGPVEGGAIVISSGVSNQSFQKRGGTMRFFGTKIMLTSSVRSDLGSFNSDTVKFELNGASIERYGSGSCIFYAKNARIYGDPVTIYNLTTALQNPEGISIETELRIRNCQTAISAASSDALLLRDVVVGQEVVRDIQTKYFASFIRGNLRKENMYFLQKPTSGSDFRDEPYIKNFASLNIKTVDAAGQPIQGVRLLCQDNAGLTVPDESGVQSLNVATSNASGEISAVLVPRWSAFYSDQPSISGTTLVSVFQDHSAKLILRKYGRYMDIQEYGPAEIPDFGDRSTFTNVTLRVDPLISYSEQDAANLLSANNLADVHAMVQYWVSAAASDSDLLHIGFNPSQASEGVGLSFGNLNLYFDPFLDDPVRYQPDTRTLNIRSGVSLSASEGLPAFTTSGTVDLEGLTVINCSYTDSTGTVIKIPITAGNIPQGARVRLFNVTRNVEIDMTVAPEGGYSRVIDVTSTGDVRLGDTLRLDAFRASGKTYSRYYTASNIVSQGPWNIITPWQTWPDANALDTDGSLVSDFTTDYVNIEIDIVDEPLQTWLGKELVAFILYKTMEPEGMRNFFGALTAQNPARWVVDVSMVDLKIDNVGTDSADQTDEVVISRSDGSNIRRIPTSGGGGIGIVIANDVSAILPSAEDLASAIVIPDVPTAQEIADVIVPEIPTPQEISDVIVPQVPTPQEISDVIVPQIPTPQEISDVIVPQVPTANEIAGAVISESVTTPIQANLRSVNNYIVTGEGTEENPWGPAGG